MKKLFFIVILLLINDSIFSQSTIIDSLETKINSVTGKEKVELLNEISKVYLNLSPDKTVEYGAQALKLAEELDYKKGEIKSLTNIGSGYYYLGNYNNALEYYQKSLKTSEKIGSKNDIALAFNNIGSVHRVLSNYDKALEYYDKSLKISEEIGNENDIARTLNNIGIVYHYLGNFDSALEYYLKSLKIYEETGNIEGQANTSNNIGVIYDTLEDYENTLKYFLKSLRIYEEIGNKISSATSLNNIGNVHSKIGNYHKALEYYFKSLKISEDIGFKENTVRTLSNIGEVYQILENYDKSLEYFLKSLKICKELGIKEIVALTMNNIGGIYYHLSDYNTALEYYLKSLKIYEEIGNNEGIARSRNNIGEIYLRLQYYEKSLSYFKKSLNLSKEIKAKEIIRNTYLNFSELYSAKEDYKKAFEYYKKYSEIKDSTFTEDMSQKIAEMQTKYETEKKEKEIDLLQKDNMIYQLEIEKHKLVKWLLFLVLIISSALIFLLYYFYKIKKNANLILEKLVEKRTKELQAEIREREKMQEQLLRSERLAGVGELAAGIAHEIRNPLGTINAVTQLYLGKYKLDKEQKELLEIILRNCEYTDKVIRELIDFSNPHEISLELKDMGKVMDNIIKHLRAVSIVHKVKIIKNCPKNLPHILLDEKWIGTAFSNCIINAFDSMPDGGVLTITVIPNNKNNEILITILDTGTGIPKENLDKIFDPFFTTKKDGAGLGLFLVHRIIKAHKGRLDIESKVGKGTKVIIRLPIPGESREKKRIEPQTNTDKIKASVKSACHDVV